MYINIIFRVVFVTSPASSPSKGGGDSAPPPLLAVAAPQTGLTSCEIGDIGYPGTVRGNPRHMGEVVKMYIPTL